VLLFNTKLKFGFVIIFNRKWHMLANIPAVSTICRKL